MLGEAINTTEIFTRESLKMLRLAAEKKTVNKSPQAIVDLARIMADIFIVGVNARLNDDIEIIEEGEGEENG